VFASALLYAVDTEVRGKSLWSLRIGEVTGRHPSGYSQNTNKTASNRSF